MLSCAASIFCRVTFFCSCAGARSRLEQLQNGTASQSMADATLLLRSIFEECDAGQLLQVGPSRPCIFIDVLAAQPCVAAAEARACAGCPGHRQLRQGPSGVMRLDACMELLLQGCCCQRQSNGANYNNDHVRLDNAIDP